MLHQINKLRAAYERTLRGLVPEYFSSTDEAHEFIVESVETILPAEGDGADGYSVEYVHAAYAYKDLLEAEEAALAHAVGRRDA